MGQSLTLYFYQKPLRSVHDSESMLRTLYDHASVKVFLPRFHKAPLQTIMGSVVFFVEFGNLIGGHFNDKNVGVTQRLLTYSQYVALRQLLYELKQCIDATSTSSPRASFCPVEECPVCMDHATSIVLPCSHAFCEPCYTDWSSEHDTCPFCRTSLEKRETIWQLEEWTPGDMAAMQVKIHEYLLSRSRLNDNDFLDTHIPYL